ncbi:hypothetical protein B0H17DRAFT_1332887 [Mycena rosella]|uniref:Uncharacterized protein n=1 Tax=Mycena rosella TaxID=1033263 RepID=A0AAD7GDT2_MYCRO|nr:hypothetical protein B0H17DRAFT_1332887 [Mycena rosella]
MSMQTITQVSVNESIVLGPSSELKGFPAAWLKRADENHVIERVHWNTVPEPECNQLHAHYSVNWNEFYNIYLFCPQRYGIEVGGLIVRHYFGVKGCIIPVGFIPQIAECMFAFTLAGPCTPDGRKEFYLLFYETGLETVSLRRYSPGFSSVEAFHLHYSTKHTAVAPVIGNEEMVAMFQSFGVYAKPVKEVESADW